jgi:hypothetical protein
VFSSACCELICRKHHQVPSKSYLSLYMTKGSRTSPLYLSYSISPAARRRGGPPTTTMLDSQRHGNTYPRTCTVSAREQSHYHPVICANYPDRKEGRDGFPYSSRVAPRQSITCVGGTRMYKSRVQWMTGEFGSQTINTV